MDELSATAADAADRLIVDEAGELVAGADVVAIGSVGLVEAAMAAGAASVALHLDADPSTAALDAALLGGARVVLLRLPKSLDELDDIARSVAAFADPDVVLVAGARLKYMTVTMNDVLARSFERVDVSHARQKSRALLARTPREVEAPVAGRSRIADLDLEVGSVGGVFAGGSLDIGTRALLDQFDRLPAWQTAIDLGCGSGILAASLARSNPDGRVIASDASAIAVAAARETAAANGLDFEVVRDLGLSRQTDGSVDLIVLNPPFHDGGAVSTDAAHTMFADAARVLRPGGQLWTVWNSHLGYRAALTRSVGPTVEIARTSKFTVTASTKEATT